MNYLVSEILKDAQIASVAIPLRLMEVFTKKDVYNVCGYGNIVTSIWIYLVKNHYFAQLRKVMDSKIPIPYEETTKPPTPLVCKRNLILT